MGRVGHVRLGWLYMLSQRGTEPSFLLTASLVCDGWIPKEWEPFTTHSAPKWSQGQESGLDPLLSVKRRAATSWKGAGGHLCKLSTEILKVKACGRSPLLTPTPHFMAISQPGLSGPSPFPLRHHSLCSKAFHGPPLCQARVHDNLALSGNQRTI